VADDDFIQQVRFGKEGDPEVSIHVHNNRLDGLPVAYGTDHQLIGALRKSQFKVAFAIGRGARMYGSVGVDDRKGHWLALFVGYLPGELISLWVGQDGNHTDKNKRKQRFHREHDQNYQKVT